MDIILDTEKTGLGYNDVILEIGICDMNSNALIDQRIKPTSKKFWIGAERIHHISYSDVQNCPEFPDVIDKLKSILIPNCVIIFNSDYDIRLLREAADSHNLPTDWIDNLDVVCCMRASGSKWLDYANYYGGMKLITARRLAGNGFIGKPHSATGDALTTAEI